VSQVPLKEQIAEVKREIALRKNVYRRRVANRDMTQEEADRHLRNMEAVQQTLEELQQPDFLSQALNEGDGVYRP